MFLQEHLAEHHTSVTKTFKAKKSDSSTEINFPLFPADRLDSDQRFFFQK